MQEQKEPEYLTLRYGLPRIDRKFPLFDPFAHRFVGIFPLLKGKLLVNEGNLRRFEETLPQIEAN